MGWQARLKDKPKFERTCNKCGGTGIKRKYISVNGIQGEEIRKCKCSLPKVEAKIIPAEVIIDADSAIRSS
jgi:hypothetical protein